MFILTSRGKKVELTHQILIIWIIRRLSIALQIKQSTIARELESLFVLFLKALIRLFKTSRLDETNNGIICQIK